jgi:hypothetical protein
LLALDDCCGAEIVQSNGIQEEEMKSNFSQQPAREDIMQQKTIWNLFIGLPKSNQIIIISRYQITALQLLTRTDIK